MDTSASDTAQRICKFCKVEKPLDDFERVSDKGWRWQCRDCRSNQETERKLTARYGLNKDQRDEMLASQGGVCLICKSDDPGHIYGWATDHCHTKGHVRGILCQPCNLALGAIERLQGLGHLGSALAYAQITV